MRRRIEIIMTIIILSNLQITFSNTISNFNLVFKSDPIKISPSNETRWILCPNQSLVNQH